MARQRALPLLILALLLGLTVAGQEVAKLQRVREPTDHPELRPLQKPGAAVASVARRDLPAVSSSVLLAESWLRRHVLAHYPATNITLVVVGRGVLCGSDGGVDRWGLVLPAVRNLHHSLVRWGLEREIRVSAVVPKGCLGFPGQLAPLLSFLRLSGYFYLVDPETHFFWSSEDTHSLVSAHRDALERLGFLEMLGDAWLVRPEKPIGRRLSSVFSSANQNPISFSSRGHAGENPNRSPPSPVFESAPDGSFSFVPVGAPSEVPDNRPPPNVLPPPCSAAPDAAPFPPAAPAPAPRAGEGERVGLWCVSKPTVPADTLQEAMDYACGEGGADCEEIKPQGSCYYPDNVVAHASYAFNSYWQKTKKSGGSCNFQGTAVLINSDPSFMQCRFLLS